MKSLLALAAVIAAAALGVVAMAFYNTWTVHHMDIVVWAFSLTCLAVPICAAIATYMIVRAKLDDKAEAAREKRIIVTQRQQGETQRQYGDAMLQEQRQQTESLRQQTEGLRQQRMGMLLNAGQPQPDTPPQNWWAVIQDFDGDDRDGGDLAPLQL